MTATASAVPNQLELDRLLCFQCCCCFLFLSAAASSQPRQRIEAMRAPTIKINKEPKANRRNTNRIESKWKRIRLDGYGLYSPSIEARYRVTENCLECPFPHYGQCNVRDNFEALWPESKDSQPQSPVTSPQSPHSRFQSSTIDHHNRKGVSTYRAPLPVYVYSNLCIYIVYFRLSEICTAARRETSSIFWESYR